LGGLLLLNACASQGAGTPKLHKASIKDVPAFTQVAFVPQKVITSVARGESATSRTTKGMGTGAVAGAGVGIAAAAVTCAGVTGPFAWLCLPAYLGYYGMIGFAAGSVLGATYGFSGLSHEDQLYVNEALSRLDQERDFQEELEQAVQAANTDLWCTREETRVRLVVRLQNIDLEQKVDDQLRMKFKGEMDLLWDDERHGPSVLNIKYNTESDEKPIATWLADGGREFGVGIDRAVAEFAQAMTERVSDMRNIPAFQARPSTL
jgi:hypothetical protein